MRAYNGFSLIELIVFIVVVGVALTGVMMAFNTALQNTVSVTPQTIAVQLASSRMEIIIGQRRMVGYTSFIDPCTGPAVCPSVSGYTTTSSINTFTIGGDATYKLIDVAVSGPNSAYADVKSVVGKY